MRALFFFFAAVAFAQDTGVIEGVVTNSVTHAPVKKALVTLRSAREMSAYMARTDAAGRFRFDTLPPGQYLPLVEAYGFARGDPPSLTVPIGQTLKDVAYSLEPYGAISGRVFDENGEPLRGAWVDGLQAEYTRNGKKFQLHHRQQTDDRGEYRIYHLTPGVWHLYVHKEIARSGISGRVHSTLPDETYAPGTGPDVVDVAPGADLTDVDFRLRRVRAFAIRGRVVDGSGQPASAYVTTTDGDGAPARPDGSFELRGLLPGTHRLRAVLSGKDPSWSRFTEVEVRDRDVDGVSLHCDAAIAIRGTLSGPGTGRVRLEALEENVPTALAAHQPDGSFTVTGLSPQTYRVRVEARDPNVYVKSLLFSDRDVSADGLVDVVPGSGPLAIVLATDVGQVAGTVAITPATTSSLVVTLAPEGRFAGRHDLLLHTGVDRANGRFQFSGVPPGEYKLFAWELPDPRVAEYPDFRRQLAGKGVALSVRAGERVQAQASPISKAEVAEILKRLN